MEDTVTGFDAAAVSPDSRLLAWGSDGRVNVFDLRSNQRLTAIDVPKRTVTAVAFSADSRSLAFAEMESPASPSRIHVVDASSRAPKAGPFDQPQMIVSLGFGPDGTRLVSRAYEGDAVVWDLEKGAALSSPADSPAPVLDLAVHPTRPLVATAPDTDEIRLLDVSSGQVLPAPVFKFQESVTSVAFHPNGDLLTIALHDGSVSSWDLETQQRVGAGLTLQGPASTLAYDSDGQHLAAVLSTATGWTVQVWNVEQWQPVLPDFTVPPCAWVKVLFSRDGSRLGWSCEGRALVLWEASVQAWIASACRIANRDLSEAEWNRYLPGEPYRRSCAR